MPYYHTYSGSESARQPPPSRRPLTASGPSADLYARIARRYCSPTFNLDTTLVSGVRGPVFEQVVHATSFWRLISFDRAPIRPCLDCPSVLVLPPHTGHCPTLVRDTVSAFLPDHAVYVAGWTDARHIPLSAGVFGLGEAAEAVAEMVAKIGNVVHLVCVTEACVIGIAAATLLGKRGHPPASLTLLGGPIDCRADCAGLARSAARHGLDWFMQTAIGPVPPPFAGVYREVFPGFLTLTGFLTHGFEHAPADPKELFLNLVAGDGDSADGHRRFFDEFLAVMDVPAELMLEWIDAVLINRPFSVEDDQTDISQTSQPLADIPLMTVEAENDAFGGGGQTHAAHLMTDAPTVGTRHTEGGAGRYALFSGARWRASVFPRVADFIASHTDQTRPPQLAQTEDLLTLSGLTPSLVAQLNREGFYFVHQLARLDEATAAQLDRRLDTQAHPLAAQIGHEARCRLAKAARS